MHQHNLISLESIPIELGLPEDCPGPPKFRLGNADTFVSSEVLDAAIRRLSDDELSLLESRIINEESLRNCAERFGMSHATVKNRERKLLQKLRTQILAGEIAN